MKNYINHHSFQGIFVMASNNDSTFIMEIIYTKNYIKKLSYQSIENLSSSICHNIGITIQIERFQSNTCRKAIKINST